MGFWSGVGGILSSMRDSALEKGAKMQEEVNKISHLSDRELAEILKLDVPVFSYNWAKEIQFYRLNFINY